MNTSKKKPNARTRAGGDGPTQPTTIASSGTSEPVGEVEGDVLSVFGDEPTQGASDEPHATAEGSAPPATVDSPSTAEADGSAGTTSEPDFAVPSMPPSNGGLPAHPAANLFPSIEGSAFDELVADIRERGLVEPVVTIETEGTTMILDGRNRYAACLLAGVEPRTVPWDGTGGSPSGFVVAKNIHRRHLTASQRATIAVDLMPLLEAEARERQAAAAEATNARRAAEPAATEGHVARVPEAQDTVLTELGTLVARVPEASVEPIEPATEGQVARVPEAQDTVHTELGTLVARVPEASETVPAEHVIGKGRSRDKAAAALGVSGRSVQDAKKIKDQAPEVLDEVKAGTVSLAEGKRIAELPEADRKTAIEDAKVGKKGAKNGAAKAEVKRADPLASVRRLVIDLIGALDELPEDARPMWWASFRKAITSVRTKI